MRHEQKPGLASHWASADSAGFRMLSSLLIELASNEYIVGRSDAERAISINVLSKRIYESRLRISKDPLLASLF